MLQLSQLKPRTFIFRKVGENIQLSAFAHDNDWWWYLSEICRVLGVQRESITQRIKSEDLINAQLGSEIRWMINFRALVVAVYGSNTRNASSFQRFVTGEVFPAIYPPQLRQNVELLNQFDRQHTLIEAIDEKLITVIEQIKSPTTSKEAEQIAWTTQRHNQEIDFLKAQLNHANYINSLLLSILATPLPDVPTPSLTKPQHQGNGHSHSLFL
ncbi:hypothetical protein C7H19_19995 [Aphanothece hegewaldii CCALA 016]|uniref:Bro-N domain-containing protein n=1 Tax=Aphanothece hegewaldii CCALA 016 TaxID=2107694 RepID=A0A2T1LTB8_9CHRO|nr:BRO family protein [Aphanothece hegewaldii]PSF33454.1 hypothetical protein C7H19_19995 [Aphanothece hegewaldii CCALA 016]